MIWNSVFVFVVIDLGVFGIPVLPGSSSSKIMLTIDKEWNSRPVNHPPIYLSLKWQPGDTFVTFEVDAPFFDDPPAPDGPVGKPFPQLWDYEVAEIFFLGADEKYLEVEVSPHGQHLLLLLNGTRNMVKDELDMDYTATIDRSQSSWKGVAKIPLSYFPVGTNRLNAYAIHGSGTNRIYQSLYPAPEGKHENPDFHRLEYFQAFDFNNLVKDQSDVGKFWDTL